MEGSKAAGVHLSVLSIYNLWPWSPRGIIRSLQGLVRDLSGLIPGLRGLILGLRGLIPLSSDSSPKRANLRSDRVELVLRDLRSLI